MIKTTITYEVDRDNTLISIDSIYDKGVYDTLNNLLRLYGYHDITTYLRWCIDELPKNIPEIGITILEIKNKEITENES